MDIESYKKELSLLTNKPFQLVQMGSDSVKMFMFNKGDSAFLHYETWKRKDIVFLRVWQVHEIFTDFIFSSVNYRKGLNLNHSMLDRGCVVFKGSLISEANFNVCFSYNSGDYDFEKINDVILKFLNEKEV